MAGGKRARCGRFFAPKIFGKTGGGGRGFQPCVHPPDCQIGANVRIGEFAVVEEGVEIGDGANISPQVFLEKM